MYKFVLIVLCLSYVSAVEKINNQIKNKNVDKSVDLTSQLVKLTTTITLENTGKEPVRSVLVVLEPGTNANVSHVGVKGGQKEDLSISLAEVEGHQDKTFYKVNLKEALESGRTSTIIFEQILTKALVPYPSSILQKEKQLVRYFGNQYFYSPYASTKQTTTVILPSKSIENYTKNKPVSLTDTSVIYGPYEKIEPFSVDQIIVHYENNAPFLTVSRLERVIEVSHWGNIAIEENIEIHHTGAKLKGPFSRYDYQRDTGSAHSIKSYKTFLPAAAHSIYYRDSNGNISTSSIKHRKEWTELELRPRFPLFGGWQSSYILGYSVPSYQYLYKQSNTQYVLSMRLLDHVFDDMHVEELETHIILPVGVTDVKLSLPYGAERLEDGVTYKYLDNLGRTIIKLRKTNLVEQHIQDFEILYNWQYALLLHEPILLSIALYLLFIVVIIYVRLDFSLRKQENVKKD